MSSEGYVSQVKRTCTMIGGALESHAMLFRRMELRIVGVLFDFALLAAAHGTGKAGVGMAPIIGCCHPRLSFAGSTPYGVFLTMALQFV